MAWLGFMLEPALSDSAMAGVNKVRQNKNLAILALSGLLIEVSQDEPEIVRRFYNRSP